MKNLSDWGLGLLLIAVIALGYLSLDSGPPTNESDSLNPASVAKWNRNHEPRVARATPAVRRRAL